MSNYIFELNFKIVIQCLNGIGDTTILKTYGVKGSATVLQFIKVYKKCGIDGLKATCNKSIYSVYKK